VPPNQPSHPKPSQPQPKKKKKPTNPDISVSNRDASISSPRAERFVSLLFVSFHLFRRFPPFLFLRIKSKIQNPKSNLIPIDNWSSDLNCLVLRSFEMKMIGLDPWDRECLNRQHEANIKIHLLFRRSAGSAKIPMLVPASFFFPESKYGVLGEIKIDRNKLVQLDCLLVSGSTVALRSSA
jgi:hypothetical protein